MKSYTDEEVKAKLREFEEKEARGELVWYSLEETEKYMDEVVARLTKQKAKE